MVEYYPGYWLAKNSDAYKLWEAGKTKELQELIKQVQQNAVALMARYDHFETNKKETK